MIRLAAAATPSYGGLACDSSLSRSSILQAEGDDRIIRIALSIGLVVVALGGSLMGPLLAVVWIVATILLVTCAIGSCPLYFVLGASPILSGSGRPRRPTNS